MLLEANLYDQEEDANREDEIYYCSGEDNAGYTEWEELSQEMKQESREIYTEEELKMLFAPRKCVTVPNVMGMTEEAALKLLNSGVWLFGRAIRIIAISEAAESR